MKYPMKRPTPTLILLLLIILITIITLFNIHLNYCGQQNNHSIHVSPTTPTTTFLHECNAKHISISLFSSAAPPPLKPHPLNSDYGQSVIYRRMMMMTSMVEKSSAQNNMNIAPTGSTNAKASTKHKSFSKKWLPWIVPVTLLFSLIGAVKLNCICIFCPRLQQLASTPAHAEVLTQAKANVVVEALDQVQALHQAQAQD